MADIDSGLVHKVHEALTARGWKISLAESCTGGLLAHALTLIPGSRGCFDSSVVCYSPNAKQRLLGLSESFIEDNGTVSEETTKVMARAVREKSGTDISLAVTGVLGPESIEDKEVGLVYVAISTKEGTSSRQFTFGGGRDEAKHAAVNAALQFLLETVCA